MEIRLDILAVGSLVKEGNEIKEAHSTSTLIRTENMNIVVDTSSRFMNPALKSSFKQLKVLPEDVDVVILTHSHHDHTENNDMFRKAKFYIRQEESMEGCASVGKDMEICKGVKLVHTPGHTIGSMSVLVNADRKYAITGDAVPLEDNIRRMVPPGLHYDKDEAMKSIKTIMAYADVIVPGHGFPFTV